MAKAVTNKLWWQSSTFWINIAFLLTTFLVENQSIFDPTLYEKYALPFIALVNIYKRFIGIQKPVVARKRNLD